MKPRRDSRPVVTLLAVCVIAVAAIGFWASRTSPLKAAVPRPGGRADTPAPLLPGNVPVSAAPRQPAAALKPLLVSDRDLASADLSDNLLVDGIVERITSQQLAARRKGFMKMAALSSTQRAALVRIARRRGLADQSGRPVYRGAALGLSIGRPWRMFVSVPGTGGSSWRDLGTMVRPPTPEAIEAAPLPAAALRASGPAPSPSSGMIRCAGLLDKASRPAPGAYALGWRMKDLPMLYRHWIADQWRSTITEEPGARPAPLDPDSTYVMWARPITFTVESQSPDGSGASTGDILVWAF